MEFSFPKPQPPEPPLEDEVIKGVWLSRALQSANKYYTPPHLLHRRNAPQVDDERLKYIAYFLDVRGQRVLEIGPYEAHHAILLEKMGVGELIGVEPRDGNVAKCRRIIEKYHLDHTTIVQQDIEKIYNGEETAKFSGPFDLVFCAGVLYHLPNPAKALEWFYGLAPTLFLATHCLCEDMPQRTQHLPPAVLEHNGQKYEGAIWREGGISDLLSGMSEVSFWVKEQDLVRMVYAAGYTKVSVLGKDIHAHFPHITILAQR